jgi:hypothetical protein
MLRKTDHIIDNPAAYLNRISSKATLVNGNDIKSVNFDTYLQVRKSLVKLPYDQINHYSRDRYNLTGVAHNDQSNS